MTVACQHWSPGSVDDIGVCAISRFGPHPHREVCARCLSEGGAHKPSLAKRAASLVRAEVSLLIKGELPPVDRDARWRVCSGRTWDGVQVGPACPEFREHARHAGDGWCDACSCGDRSSARLRRKATMPDAECPFIGRWAKR